MTNRFFTIVFFLLICAQVTGQRATRQSAQDAFNRGDYNRAYSEFSELLEVYSRDPLYKYYASVSLIKLEQDAEQAEKLIKEAIENNSAARSIPSDATFYLARALHMNGNFSEATAEYQRFANQANRRTVREFRVQEYIQQCTRGEGAIARTQPERQTTEITNSAAIPIFIAPPEVVVARETTPVVEPLTGDYSDILDKALTFQHLADSIRRVNNRPNDQVENERLAVTYQNSANEMFAAAQTLMNPKAEEPVQVGNSNVVEITSEPQTKIPTSVATQDIYYYFKISDNTETVQIDPDIPEGLNYRIQIGAFRNPVAPAFFKGISPAFGITNVNTGVRTYYAGMFRRIADARIALAEVRNKGFNDSFIVFFLGDRAVSADRAAVLEQEWGTKPFERAINNNVVAVTANNTAQVATNTSNPATATADELLPTLVFRVEVMRVARAITPAALETLQTLAGNRGLDVITADNRQIAYIIGNFITYSSAAEYADLLVRNGYRDAKVVAWLGNREIPLDTARQLFESLE